MFNKLTISNFNGCRRLCYNKRQCNFKYETFNIRNRGIILEQSAEEIQFNKMTKMPVARLVSSLAVPSIISMLVTSIYNMADTFFVSQLGTSASAAVGVVFSLQSIIQAFGFTLGMGSGSYISRSLGAKDHNSAAIYASSAFAAAILAGGILLTAGIAFLSPLMVMLGATPTVLPYARDYSLFILIAAPIMCASFVLNNILRAEGKAFFSMVGLAIGGILNILLDPLFIFTFNMGIKGAAISTMVSQCVGFVVLISFFARKKSIVGLSGKCISRNIKIYLNIYKVGLPTLCRQGLASVATALLTVNAALYGDAAIAAVNIATKIYLLVRGTCIGLGQGFQPVAGYNYGAKKYERVKKAFVFVVFFGSIICTLCAVVCLIFRREFMAFFRSDDLEVIKIGSEALVFFVTVMPLLAYSTYTNQLLQCLGKSKRAAFLASCRQGVFFIPLILILPRLFGITGIELTQPLADLLTFAISIPIQIQFFRKEL